MKRPDGPSRVNTHHFRMSHPIRAWNSQGSEVGRQNGKRLQAQILTWQRVEGGQTHEIPGIGCRDSRGRHDRHEARRGGQPEGSQDGGIEEGAGCARVDESVGSDRRRNG